MSMGEIAYDIRKHVGILIGAEGLEPQFGWPYRGILAGVRDFLHTRNKSHMLPKELAKLIVEEYVKHYLGLRRSVGRSTALAAVDLAQTDRLKDASRRTRRGPPASSTRRQNHEKLLLAHWYAQSTRPIGSLDLADFCCDQVQGRLPEAIRDRPSRVHRCHRGNSPWSRALHHQVRVQRLRHSAFVRSLRLFPRAVVAPEYEGMDFAKGDGSGFCWRAHPGYWREPKMPCFT